MIQGVHHISLKACGEAMWEETVLFYTQVFGFPLVRRWGAGNDLGCMIDLGHCLLEVTANGAVGLKKGICRHIAFQVDDVNAAASRARVAGRPILIEPVDKNLGGSYPIRIAFCTGPSGEEIEFIQER